MTKICKIVVASFMHHNVHSQQHFVTILSFLRKFIGYVLIFK